METSAHAVNSRYKVRHRIYREADDESGPHLVPENMMEVIFVYINSDNLQGASDVEKQWLYLLRYSRLIQSAPGVARALELLNVARWSDHEIEAYRSEVSMIFELEETVGVLTSQLEDKRAQLEDTQTQLEDTQTQLEDTQTQLHDMQTQLEDTQAQMQVQLQVQAQMQARILELEAKLGENHDDSPERSRSSSSSEKRKDMDTLSQVSQQHRKKK
jgi:septal ring factor EnvC (AmiA/AmiB activator)